MGNSSSDNIVPSNNINQLLLDNNDLREKYENIKSQRKSYKNRIKILEKKVENLTNKITELEINSRDQYQMIKRKGSDSSYLYDRIKILEKKINNAIILEPQSNNIPFCSKKNNNKK
tara:strand:+ start:3287 stop:3637 length:351 start_codon:yes stop_codon:yes gene_type:complete